MAEEYRHELKYYINMQGYYILRSRLSAALRLDENSGSEGDYHIRSLYFDDADDVALKTKISGVDDREKFRVRIYNISDNIIRLERKIKRNTYILKHSCGLTRGEFDRLMQKDVAFLLNKRARPCGAVYYNTMNRGLRPVKIVDYRREAYTYPVEDVRITFDKGLRMGTTFDIFDPDMLTVPMLEPGQMILEVKFNAFLPVFIRNMFFGVETTASAISKYVICRKYDV
jgi:SPX domain protein involved in polyphosphate accumulation